MLHFVLFCITTAMASNLNSKSNKLSRDGILSDSSTTKNTQSTGSPDKVEKVEEKKKSAN